MDVWDGLIERINKTLDEQSSQKSWLVVDMIFGSSAATLENQRNLAKTIFVNISNLRALDLLLARHPGAPPETTAEKLTAARLLAALQHPGVDVEHCLYVSALFGTLISDRLARLTADAILVMGGKVPAVIETVAVAATHPNTNEEEANDLMELGMTEHPSVPDKDEQESSSICLIS